MAWLAVNFLRKPQEYCDFVGFRTIVWKSFMCGRIPAFLLSYVTPGWAATRWRQLGSSRREFQVVSRVPCGVHTQELLLSCLCGTGERRVAREVESTNVKNGQPSRAGTTTGRRCSLVFLSHEQSYNTSFSTICCRPPVIVVDLLQPLPVLVRTWSCVIVKNRGSGGVRMWRCGFVRRSTRILRKAAFENTFCSSAL